MKITYANNIGRRFEQEDRFIVHNGKLGTLLAVMDGHGGKETSEFIAENLKKIFLAARRKFSVRKAILTTFGKLNLLTRGNDAGSTLSLVWIPKGGRNAYVAILGDSPVIIKNPDGESWISPEHNARTNLKERQSAESRGGFYEDGYLHAYELDPNGLQLSRSFGDVHFGNFLGREPEIFTVPLRPGAVIIVASDGLVDPNHKDSSACIQNLLEMAANGSEAKDLVEDALARETRDNVTAILCFIN